MPLLGFLLGVQFKEYITSIDHWIAFILLGIIGINMHFAVLVPQIPLHCVIERIGLFCKKERLIHSFSL